MQLEFHTHTCSKNQQQLKTSQMISMKHKDSLESIKREPAA